MDAGVLENRIPNADAMPPGKPCGRRLQFSPQMRVNRFVFLNLPILSLGMYLSLMASPHTPFPAGYVTLPVHDKSPPLRLMPHCSMGQAIG